MSDFWYLKLSAFHSKSAKLKQPVLLVKAKTHLYSSAQNSFAVG